MNICVCIYTYTIYIFCSLYKTELEFFTWVSRRFNYWFFLALGIICKIIFRCIFEVWIFKLHILWTDGLLYMLVWNYITLQSTFTILNLIKHNSKQGLERVWYLYKHNLFKSIMQTHLGIAKKCWTKRQSAIFIYIPLFQ